MPSPCSHEEPAALVPTSEAFSGLDLKGKVEKKKKRGEEERPAPWGKVIIGLGLAASQICRGCAPEGFFGEG